MLVQVEKFIYTQSNFLPFLRRCMAVHAHATELGKLFARVHHYSAAPLRELDGPLLQSSAHERARVVDQMLVLPQCKEIYHAVQHISLLYIIRSSGLRLSRTVLDHNIHFLFLPAGCLKSVHAQFCIYLCWVLQQTECNQYLWMSS